MATDEHVQLDPEAARAGAARLREAGARWGGVWAGHAAALADLEARTKFGDDEMGLALRQNYQEGSQGLGEAAEGVCEGTEVYADACSKGVAMDEHADERARARLLQV